MKGAPQVQLPHLVISVYGDEGFVDCEATVERVTKLVEEMESGTAIEASIYPTEELLQTPRMTVDVHPGVGFVVMAFEDDESVGFYPTTGDQLGRPEVPIELGGQSLEKWPRELFVPRDIALRALITFVTSGTQDSTLHWVANDVFEREIVWEA